MHVRHSVCVCVCVCVFVCLCVCVCVCVCLYVCACACGWVGRYSKRVTRTHLVARSSVFSRMRFSSSLPIPATGRTQYESFPASAIPLLQSLILLFSEPKLQAVAPQHPFSMKAAVVITLMGVQNGPGPLPVPQVRHMHTFHASTCSLSTSTDFSLSSCWLRHGLKKTPGKSRLFVRAGSKES